jgi:hypothetical protein
VTTRESCGSERVYRVLLVAYPRSFRREMGEEMARVVGDRRVHEREPLWRLWPALLRDTAANATRIRGEDLMERNRPIVIGALTTLAILAMLSSGPITALPFLAALGVLFYVSSRRDQAIVLTAPRRSWRRWLPVGVVLVVVSVAYFLSVSEEELSEPQWAFVFFGTMSGILTTVTGLVLLIGERRRAAVP